MVVNGMSVVIVEDESEVTAKINETERPFLNWDVATKWVDREITQRIKNETGRDY
jgi:hypothetical protein